MQHFQITKACAIFMNGKEHIQYMQIKEGICNIFKWRIALATTYAIFSNREDQMPYF